MTPDIPDNQAASPRWLRPALCRLDAYAAALFAGSPGTFAAFGIVIAVLALELVMNMRNGQGWVSILHLVIVGPLWLAMSGITLHALARQVFSSGRRSAK